MAVVAYADRNLSIDGCARLARRDGGIVVAGRRGIGQATRLRKEYDFSGSLWLDPAEYTDLVAGWEVSIPGMDPWQLAGNTLELTEFLTPARTIERGDSEALRVALGKVYPEMGRPVRVVLPLDSWWLRDGLGDLLEQIITAARPVALVLRGSADPLSAAGAVSGLLAVLRAGLDVQLLRTDVSGLGAVAGGARLAAIGTSPSTRALRGPIRPGPDERRDAERGTPVFVPALCRWLSYRELRAVARVPSPLLIARGLMAGLRCGCPVCHGRTLLRFGDPPPAREEARAHDLAVLPELAGGVEGVDDPLAGWVDRCRVAVEANRRLAAAAGVTFRIGSLRQWAELDVGRRRA